MTKEHLNLVAIRGIVGTAPVARSLTSGVVMSSCDVTTLINGKSLSVPVSVAGPLELELGTPVVVVGSVRRRFFRVGGATQSRTEVTATQVIVATQRRQVAKALATLAEALAS